MDTKAPPAIDEIEIVGANPETGEVSSLAPTIKGKGEAGLDVVITLPGGEEIVFSTSPKDGQYPLTYGPADGNGEANFELTLPELNEGFEGELSIQQQDKAGNKGPATLKPIDIDTTAPSIGQITTIVDDVDPISGSLANGAFTNDNQLVFSGNAEAGGLVKLYNQLDGTLIGEVIADATGLWTITSQTLVDNQYEFYITVTDRAGNTSNPSNIYNITVDTEVNVIPGFEFNVTNVVDNIGQYTGEIKSGDFSDDKNPTFNGRGEPGTRLKLFVDGKEVEITPAVLIDEKGDWSYELATALVNGKHLIQFSAVDAAGNETSKMPQPAFEINIDTEVSTLPEDRLILESVTDNVGELKGALKSNDHTDDTRPTFSGKAEVGATIRLYINGDEVALDPEVIVQADGSWSFELPANLALADGQYGFQFKAVDKAGNMTEFAPTTPFNLVVDTSIPAIIDVTQWEILDDVGQFKGPITNGTMTDDRQPTVTGRVPSEVSEVAIFVDGKEVGRAMVANNAWSYQFTEDLPLGNRYIEVSAINKAGTYGEKSRIDFTIDIAKPPSLKANDIDLYDDVGKVKGTIEPGSSTDDRQPEYKGIVRSEVIKFVNIYLDGNYAATVEVDSEGNWSYTVPAQLSGGEHKFQAAPVSASGIEGDKTTEWAFNVLATRPERPSIIEVTDDFGNAAKVIQPEGITNDKNLTIRGTAESSIKVIINVNGVYATEVTSGADGKWVIDLPNNIITSDGTYNITAYVKDAAGQDSDETGIYQVIYDGTAPSKPIFNIEDAQGQVKGSVVNNSTIDDSAPKISGKAESGDSKIEIFNNGTSVGFANVNTDGTWSMNLALADGSHKITIKETDKAGNVSSESDALNFVVNTTALVLTVDYAEVNAITADGPVTEINTGGLTNDRTPTLVGKAQPGAVVEIWEDGIKINATNIVADANGQWRFNVPSNFINDNGDGIHTYQIKTEDAAGNKASKEFKIKYDLTAPDKGEIVSVEDTTTPNTGLLTNGSGTNETSPILRGTGEAGTTVRVYDKVTGNEVIASTTVDNQGNWVLKLTALPDGEHEFQVTFTDAAGNTSPMSDAFKIDIDSSKPEILMPDSFEILDNVGEFQGPIKANDTTDDNKPSLIGRAPDDVKQVAIFVDGIEVDRATVLNNEWSYDIQTALSDGQHRISIAPVNRVGTLGEKTEVVFSVETAQPGKLNESLLDLVDNVGDIQGTIKKGDSTDDRLPEFKGTAGSTTKFVKIYLDGDYIATVDVKVDGSWSYTPPSNLSGGNHRFEAAPLTKSGVEGEKTQSWNFNVIAQKPAQPTIDTLVDDYLETGSVIVQPDGLTNDKTLTVNGRAEAGVTINLLVNGQPAGTVKAGMDGKWSLDIPATSITADGQYNVTATATDAAGQTSEEETGIYRFNYDGTAPNKPVILAITDSVGDKQGSISKGDIIDDETPVISGKAESGNSSVAIYNNGSKIGMASVNPDGTWSYTLNLAQGPHNITVVETDKAGNASNQSDAFNFTIDSSSVELKVNYLEDNKGNTATQVLKGGLTNDDTPLLVGTATPGATIELYENGEKLNIGVVKADGTGKWSFIIPLQYVTDGEHFYEIRTQSKSGNIVKAPFDVTYDLTAPNAGVIESVEDTVSPVLGTLENDDATNDSSPTLRGKAEPGSKVIVFDRFNNQTIGEAPVDLDGNWVFKATELEDGIHRFVIKVVDQAGNISGDSNEYRIEVDTSVPPALPANAFDVIDDVGQFKGKITPNSFTDDKRPDLEGRAPNGVEEIAIFIDGKEIGRVPVINNTWNYKLTKDLADGEHTIAVAPVNHVGTLGDKTSLTFTVDTSAPTALNEQFLDLFDNEGAKQGTIVRGESTDDRQPEFKGIAGGKTKFIKIYLDGKEVTTVPVNEDGTWSYTPPTNLSGGMHNFQAAPLTQSGVEGNLSSAWNFNVLASKPSIPTIDTLTDNYLEDNGSQIVQPGGLTNDKTITVNGRSEGGVKIIILLDDVEVAQGTASADGRWSVEVPANKITNDGQYKITAIAKDAADQSSDPTGEYLFNYDGTAPNKPALPTITDSVGDKVGVVENNSTIDDVSPVITGKAESGDSVVTIFDNNLKIGTATVNSDGTWSFTLSLSQGPHSITVQEKDKAGNNSAKSDPLNFNVDSSKVNLTVDYLEDNFGNDNNATQQIKNNGLTNDKTPVLVGTATPGSVIEIWEGNELLSAGNAPVADITGKWTFAIPSQYVTDGKHNYEVRTISKSGNENKYPFEIEYDVTAPSKGTIDSVEDSVAPLKGFINKNEATNDSSPTLRGKAEIGSTVTIYDKTNGQKVGEIPTGLDGNWLYKVTELDDGIHRFVITVTDKAGNVSVESDEYPIEVDTFIAPALDLSDVRLVDDVGTIQGDLVNDAITDDNYPTLVGLNAPDYAKEIAIFVNKIEVGRAIVNPDGSWEYQFDKPIADGKNSISIAAVTKVGNVGSNDASWSITVDTASPSGIKIEITGITEDTEFAGDFITKDNTLTISGTLTRTLRTDERVQISLDDGETWEYAVPTGNSWYFDNSSTILNDGEYNVQVRVVDLAGNVGTTASKLIVIDTKGPDATNSIDIVSITPDTGVEGDFKTSENVITVSGKTTKPIKSDEIVKVSYDNGKTWHQAIVEGGDWSVEIGPLPNNNYTLIAQIFDNAGNEGPSDNQLIEINSSSVSNNVIEITGMTTNTGETTDFITSDNTLVFNGTLLNALGNGESIEIRINNEAWIKIPAADITANSWIFKGFESRQLGDGTYTIDVRIVNSVGSPGSTDSQQVVIDTVAPSKSNQIYIDSIAPDTGIEGDFVTSSNTLRLNGHFDSVLGQGEKVLVSFNNGQSWQYATVINGTQWYYEDNTRYFDEGDYNVKVRIVDAAWNEGASAEQLVVIDNTPPVITKTIDILGISPDTGLPGDYKTAADKFDITGKISAPIGEDIVKVTLDGITWYTVTFIDSTNWTVNIGPFANGKYDLVAQVFDKAGNGAAKDTQAVEIDKAYVTPNTITFDAITDDTGIIGDFKTKDTTLIFTGKLGNTLGENEQVWIKLNNSDWQVATVNGTDWSFMTGTLADGVYNVDYQIVNINGAVGAKDNKQVTIDNKGPDNNQIYIDSITEDSGYDNVTKKDFITNDNKFTVSGHVDTILKADEYIQISLNNGLSWEYATKNGNKWYYSLFDNAVTLNDGTYDIKVRIVDDAENIGATANKAVVVDTSTPSDVDIAIVSISPDNGIPNDFQTNTGNIRVNGTLSKAVEGGRVKVSLDGGQSWLVATVEGTNWYIDLANLNTATYTLRAQVVDLANNEGRFVDKQIVINTGGVAANTISITEISDDSGVVGDWITNDRTLTIKGTLANGLSIGERVEISIDGKTWVQVEVQDRVWVYNNSASSLADGKYTIDVRIINNVNDIGALASKEITVDGTAPDASNKVYFDRISDDNGISSTDFKTNDKTLEFFGHLDKALGENEFVEISFNNGATWVRTEVDGVNWYFDKRSQPFENGSYPVKVRVIDHAGNLGSVTDTQDVMIDDTQVLQNSILITTVTDDTGSSNSDFLTKDKNVILGGTIERNLSVGEYIRVSLNGGKDWLRATVNPDGKGWTLDLTQNPLIDDVYSLKAQIVNQFGTPGAEHERELTIDATITDATISIDGISDDTNIAGDFNTADNTLIFNGRLSVTLASDEFVEISLDGGVTWRKAEVTNTNWTYDNTKEFLNDKLDGYDVKVRVIDNAGNISGTASQNVIINKEPPVGNISVDKVSTLDTTPTVTGSFSGLRAGETVQVTIAGKVYSERNGNLTINSATGKWSLKVSDADALNYGSRNDMLLDVQARIVTLSGAVKEDSSKDELTIFRAATVTKSPDFDYLADDTPIFIGRGNVGTGDVITVVIKNNLGQTIATFTSNAGGGVVVDKVNGSWRIPEEAWATKGLTLDRGTYTISTSTKTADGKGEQSGNTESFTIYKPETSVSVADAREQTVSKIYGMDDGSYWVFWVSNMGSANAFDMFAQHYDQKGNAIGSRITVADKDTNAGHSNSDALHYISAYDVHFNTDESFVVYYQTNNGLIPNIAKFNKDGTKISDVPAPNVREWELDANYVQMDNGDYALVFSSGTVHTYNVFMQRFKADGTAIDSVPIQQTFDNNRGSGFTQSLTAVGGNGAPSMEGLTGAYQYYACIGGISTTNLGNGLFAMTYMTSRESNLDTAKDADIFLRVYDFKTGQPVATEIKLTSNDKFYQVDPAVVALKEGGFVVTWASNHESTNANNSGGQMDQFNMYSRRYTLDANNKPVALDAVDKRVNTSTDGVNGVGYNRIQGHYDIAALEHGGYVIVWTKFTAGNRAEIYSQTFDAAGNKLGGETLVSTSSVDKLDLRPDVTGLSDGGYAITWTSSTDKSTDWWTNVGGDIYSVIVNADGSIRGKGDDNIYPTNASYIDNTGALVGNDGVNTLDGKNGATSFNAGSGNDYIIAYDTSFDFIDGGDGNDTLIWNSFDNLDLSQISSKVDSIEYLHLNDAYANTLTLDINDVLAMTPTDDHLLVIQGGATDKVDLDLTDSQWSTLGAQSFRGETYNVYVHATEDAQLWIQQGIAVI
ncbi:Ig-like domain-containing protein [Thorsellia anophelis]|uniref:Ig-like domain-containing protein n=1 Tax=Thorsellia anophelis TaxID=336804 RepID=UPI000B848479|nr:Ig-like domain-containing protein [Thorsellia anophelis]